MDHSVAHLMEYEAHTITDSEIKNEFTHDDKNKSIEKSEKSLHHKEQQLQLKFYNGITEHIARFKQVLLFGPTNAKNELYNKINSDARFIDINITVQAADKMTREEEHAVVLKYFADKK